MLEVEHAESTSSFTETRHFDVLMVKNREGRVALLASPVFLCPLLYYVGCSNTLPTNPRWRTAAILKN